MSESIYPERIIIYLKWCMNPLPLFSNLILCDRISDCYEWNWNSLKTWYFMGAGHMQAYFYGCANCPIKYVFVP